MIRTYAHKRWIGFGLAAIVGAIGSAALPAAAIESWVVDGIDSKRRVELAADGTISSTEARSLARHYLQQLGYNRIGRDQYSARVLSVQADGDKWRVEFKYDPQPRRTALFFIDKESGLLGMKTAAVPSGRTGTTNLE